MTDTQAPERIWAAASKDERGWRDSHGFWRDAPITQDSIDRIHYHVPVEYIRIDLLDRLQFSSDVALTQSHAEIARLREALEYYAYEHIGPNDGPWGVNSNDFGHVARTALAAIPLKGETE